jgi:hypothetical protein
MEMTYSSENSVDVQQTTMHRILEDRRFHNRYCENLISKDWMNSSGIEQLDSKKTKPLRSRTKWGAGSKSMSEEMLSKYWNANVLYEVQTTQMRRRNEDARTNTKGTYACSWKIYRG